MTYEAQDTWSSPWVSPSPISLHRLSVSPPLILVPHFLVLNHTPYCHIVFTYAAFPFSSVQSLSHVQLFVTLSNPQSLFKFMSIESVMPSNHLILCHPLVLPSIFPSIRVFSRESALHQVAKVMEFQLQHHSFQWTLRTDLLQNGLAGSPCSPRDSRVFSSTTVQKHQFFGSQLSL